LLRGLADILKTAAALGLNEVEDVFYSRQSYFFPEKQLSPHNTFLDEVHALDKYFKNGAAYVVGKLNGNHFNIYTSQSRARQMASLDVHPFDCTLEILMADLDRECAQYFYSKDKYDSAQASALSGIAALLPNAKLDAHLFSPYGYSANAIQESNYFTIHVTPQPSCSFASFETNVPMQDYSSLIQAVLKVFKPGRFILTTIANGAAMSSFATHRSGFDLATFAIPRNALSQLKPISREPSPTSVQSSPKALDGFVYVQTDDIVNSFGGYSLCFTQFETPASTLRRVISSDALSVFGSAFPSFDEVEKVLAQEEESLRSDLA